MPSIPTEFFDKALDLSGKIIAEQQALLAFQKEDKGDVVDVDVQQDLINEKTQILALSTMNLVQTANRYCSQFADDEEQPLGLMYLSYASSLVCDKSVKFVQAFRKTMENRMDFLAQEEQEEHQRELQELVIHFRAACEILKQGADCNATQKFRDALAKAEEIVVLTDLLMDTALTVDSSQLLRYNRSFSAEIHHFIDLIHAVTDGRTNDEEALDTRALMTEEALPQLLKRIIVAAKNISCAKRGAFTYNQAAQVRSRTLVDVFDLTLQLQKMVFGYDLDDPTGPQLKLAYRPPRPTRGETRDHIIRSKVFEELKQTRRRASVDEEHAKKDMKDMAMGVEALREFAASQKKARVERETSEKELDSGSAAEGKEGKGKSLFSPPKRSKSKGETLKRKSKKTAAETLSRTADIKQLFLKSKKKPSSTDSSKDSSTEQRLHLDMPSPTAERRQSASKSTLEALFIDERRPSSASAAEEEAKSPGATPREKGALGDLSLSSSEAGAASAALAKTTQAATPQESPVATTLAGDSRAVPKLTLDATAVGDGANGAGEKSPRKQAEEVAMEELQVYAKSAIQVMKRLHCFAEGWADDEENIAKLQKELVASFKLSSRRATLLNVRKNQSTSRMVRLAVNSGAVTNAKGRLVPEPAFQVTSSWRKISSSTSNLLKDVDLPVLKAESGPLLERTKTFVKLCLEHVQREEQEGEEGGNAAAEELGEAAAEVFRLLLKITSICGKQEAADFLAVPVAQLLANGRTEAQRDEEYLRSVAAEELHVVHLLCKTHLEGLRRRARGLCSLIAQLVSAVASIPTTSSAMPQSLFMQVIAVTWSIKEQVEAMLDHAETARYLHMRYIAADEDEADGDASTAVAWARLKGRSIGSRGDLHVIAASRSNIWDAAAEPSPIDEEAGGAVAAGSINQLVRFLCGPDASDEFEEAFFTTAPTFAALDMIVRKLRQLYLVPEDHAADKPQVLAGVVRATRRLIQICHLDLTRKMVQELERLFDLLRADDAALAESLETALEEALAARTRLLAVPGPSLDTHLEGDVAGFPPPAEVFMKTPADVLAAQITVTDFALFSKIQAREFFDLAWSKTHLRHRAPNIMAMIGRVNKVSYWVPNVILWHSSMNDRAKAVEKFIALAEELRKLKNYSALMGILGGLGMSSTARLKFTFLAVNEQRLAVQKDLQKLMSSNKSFAAYRAELASCEPPAVPYLGVYLSDLTFINDGNADLVGEARAINFKKRRMVHRVLAAVRHYQQGAYDLPQDERAALYTLALPQLTDDDLYQLSLKREPRGAEISDLLSR